MLADIYGNSGDYKEAVDNLQKAIDIEPDNIDLRYLLADYLTLAKEYDEAYSAYQNLLKLAPNNPKVYHGLGILFYFKGDFREAIEYLSRETELNFNPNSYFLLGMAYGKLGEYREAVMYLEKHLESLPVNETEKRKKAESVLLFFKSKLF